MNCPLCNVKLQLTDRQGVAIDYCPECRGIWLDRGELEKILEMSVAQRQTTEPSRNRGEDGSRANHSTSHRDDSYERPDKHRKKESWLSELFDFD